MYFLPAHRLRLYRQFKSLEVTDFHGIIRFYEQQEEGIRSLDLDAYFECTLAYTDALLETAEYGKHGVMCDHLLELIIVYNIDTWGGEDIYNRILYDKAVSLFYQMEYSRSEYVLRELIKINPNQPTYISLLKKCLLRQKPAWLFRARAASVLLVLLSAFSGALHLFVFQVFFKDYEHQILWLQQGLMATGLTLLLGAESLHLFRCSRQANTFARAAQQR
jgi:hypothetical protein